MSRQGSGHGVLGVVERSVHSSILLMRKNGYARLVVAPRQSSNPASLLAWMLTGGFMGREGCALGRRQDVESH